MNLPFLAQRIREFRKKRGLTLEQLADRSQLTQSVLSKVENSRVTPSLAALGRISEALGVTLSELVAGIESNQGMVVVRRDERPTVERDHPAPSFVYHSLAPTRHPKRIEPLMVELPPGSQRDESLAHRNDEFILVMKGAVEIECEGERCRLETGDSVYINGSKEHRVFNATGSTAEILCVLSGEEQFPTSTAE